MRRLQQEILQKMEKVAVKNFFHPSVSSNKTDLYQSALGWCAFDFHEAMAVDPAGVLRYYLETGFDFEFFDSVTLRWYCIDNRYDDRIALSRLRLAADWDGKYLEDSRGPIDWVHYNDIPDVIFMCATVDEFLQGATIDGTPISEVMTRSWIVFS